MENLNSRGCSGKIKSLEGLKEKLITLKEHECIEIDTQQLETLTDLGINFKEPNYDEIEKLQFLGLFLRFDPSNFKLCAHYFVGASWLIEKEVPIRVYPKERNNKKPDYLKIFLTLLEDEEIVKSSHFQKAFKVDIEKPPLKVEKEDLSFLYLVFLAYLTLLKDLVKKGLKKGFLCEEQVLNSRIKGKLNIKLTSQRFFYKGKYTQTVCKFDTLTEDILENRILKAALLQVERFLKNYPFKGVNIDSLLGYLKNAFWGVSTVKISAKDFLKVKESPFFPEYRKTLRLAQIILKNLGSNPFASFKGGGYITPYVVNMPKLFELYVWKKLREEYEPSKILYQHSFTGGDIPDFVIKGENLILDAKYKYLDQGKISKEDIGQLARYGRNLAIRRSASGSENREPRLCIVYPTFEESKEKTIEGKYFNFYMKPLRLPV